MFSATWIPLNPKERLCLVSLACVLMAGSTIHYISRNYPSLLSWMDWIEEERIVVRYDLNQATAAELEEIPYIGAYTAQKILEYRRLNGGFQSVEEVRQLSGIREKNYEKFRKYLRVHSP